MNHTMDDSKSRSAASQRALKLGSEQDLMTEYLNIAARNNYHAARNPTGIVNIGTSVNRLMERELEDRLNKPDMFVFRPAGHQHYFDFRGTAPLRDALSYFFSRHFTGGKPVPPDELIVLNGVTACMDGIAFAVCDAGDIALTPTPVYGRIFTDFQERSAVQMMPVHLLPKEEAGTEKDFELTTEALERRVEQLGAEGRKVGAFVLLNPQNPLGDVYPPQLVMDLLRICAKHEIHVIIDEVYALSVHAEGVVFSSVLSYDDLPDPDRTHFVWGLAKDFCLAGLCTGVIHTRHPSVLRSLEVIGNYQAVPSLVQDSVAVLLNDAKWCDEFFLPTSRKKLRDRYNRTLCLLRNQNISVRPGQAGFFVWLDLRPSMRERTVQEEIALFKAFIEAGVYIVPGSELYCAVPGWFRLVMSVADEELCVGINRLSEVLKTWKK